MIKELKKQLEIDEGKSLKIYLDHLGFKTVGIGHLVKKTDPEFKLPVGTKITQERCDELFEQDVKICINDCKIVFKDWDCFLDEVQQIMANMMFNLGRNRFYGFGKMIVHVENKNYKMAAYEMKDSKWFKQVGKRSERLYKRMINLGV